MDPSEERLSRITSSLCLDRNAQSNFERSSSLPTPDLIEKDANVSQQSHLEDLSRNDANISDQIESEDNREALPIEFDSGIRNSHRGNEKEESSVSEVTQMRKTAQALFELEESLLDQHITNIKVSGALLLYHFPLFCFLYSLSVWFYRRMLKC